MKTKYLFTFVPLVLLALAGSANASAPDPLAAPTAAWIFEVTKTVDTNDGACDPDDCSLREAIIAANAMAGADIVMLPEGQYLLTIASGAEGDEDLDPARGDLDITDDLILNGADARTTVIDANSAFRVFQVGLDATAALSQLTIQHGYAQRGGGIKSGGMLNIEHCRLLNNSAEEFGGALFVGWMEGKGFIIRDSLLAGNTSSGIGGAISVVTNGTFRIEDSAVMDNSALWAGGIAGYGGVTLTIVSSTIGRNQATEYAGGIDWETNPLILNNVTIAGNSAPFVGGLASGVSGLGGTLIVQNSLIAGNSADTSPDCLIADPEMAYTQSLGYNLIGDVSGCEVVNWQPSDRFGAPGLATPQREYFPLQASSQAIDAGESAACPTFDQLGNPRTDGDGDGIVECDIGAIEHQGPYGDGGDNKLKSSNWYFLAPTSGVRGSITDGILALTVSSSPARACWHQDLNGVPLRGQVVHYEADLRQMANMNSVKGFGNPYISLQVQRGDGTWQYNYGGIGNSTATAGGPWVGKNIDVVLPTDMKALRASFCVWDATPGTAQAQSLLLRLATAPPPPAPPPLSQNLLSSHWMWAPATPAISGVKEAVALAINVSAAKASGCWIQDMPGAALRGATVRYEASMAKTGVLNRITPKLFVNPYVSLQAQTTDGVWHYNYGGILNSRATSGGPYVTESRDIVLPANLMTLRAAFCVWEAEPGTGRGKDFLLRTVNPVAAQGADMWYPTWMEYTPDTPSALPADVAGLELPQVPEMGGLLYLPLMRQ